MSKPEETTGRCAHPDCDNVCEEDGYCFGCEEYICDEHSPNMDAIGNHLVEEHWEDPNEETW